MIVIPRNVISGDFFHIIKLFLGLFCGLIVDFPPVFHRFDKVFFHNCGKVLIVVIMALLCGFFMLTKRGEFSYLRKISTFLLIFHVCINLCTILSTNNFVESVENHKIYVFLCVFYNLHCGKLFLPQFCCGIQNSPVLK